MSQIALDEEGMAGLARALVSGAERLEQAAASMRRIGLETGRSAPAVAILHRLAADRRNAAADVRRRARAAHDEERRAGPRAAARPVCGPEWRTMTRPQVAAANARYRLEALRHAGGSPWAALGTVGGWLRREVQNVATGAQHDTAAITSVSNWESRSAAHGLAWMDARGRAVSAALPGPLRPAAKIFGSGWSGMAHGAAGGVVGAQAIVATNLDASAKLGVAASHADVDEAADVTRQGAQSDWVFVEDAALGMAQTARVMQTLDPRNPLAYVQLATDVNDKGVTNALADDARAAGAEGPGALLMLAGDPPTPVGKTVVAVGEAGALKHGDAKIEREKRNGKTK